MENASIEVRHRTIAEFFEHLAHPISLSDLENLLLLTRCIRSSNPLVRCVPSFPI